MYRVKQLFRGSLTPRDYDLSGSRGFGHGACPEQDEEGRYARNIRIA